MKNFAKITTTAAIALAAIAGSAGIGSAATGTPPTWTIESGSLEQLTQLAEISILDAQKLGFDWKQDTAGAITVSLNGQTSPVVIDHSKLLDAHQQSSFLVIAELANQAATLAQSSDITPDSAQIARTVGVTLRAVGAELAHSDWIAVEQFTGNTAALHEGYNIPTIA